MPQSAKRKCEYGQHRETDDTMVIRDRCTHVVEVGFLSRLSDETQQVTSESIRTWSIRQPSKDSHLLSIGVRIM